MLLILLQLLLLLLQLLLLLLLLIIIMTIAIILIMIEKIMLPAMQVIMNTFKGWKELPLFDITILYARKKEENKGKHHIF